MNRRRWPRWFWCHRIGALHWCTAPAQLARRLRLRAPTVTHHLNTLRLAGLVQLTIGMGTGKETKHYAARSEAVAAAFASLQGFLEKGQGEHTEDQAIR